MNKLLKLKMGSKILLLLMAIPFLVGYKTFPNGNDWDISKTDPYIYVRFCKDLEPQENDVDSDDTLYSFGATVTHSQIISSIFFDFESIASSYIYLAATTDPTFSEATYGDRVIDICEGTIPGSTGYAQQELDSNGHIIGCKITIGSFKSKVKPLLRVLTHEIGHCLGLDHPQESSKAVMSYFSDQDKYYRLQNDDKAGLTYLYPVDDDYKRVNTFGASCSAN